MYYEDTMTENPAQRSSNLRRPRRDIPTPSPVDGQTPVKTLLFLVLRTELAQELNAKILVVNY